MTPTLPLGSSSERQSTALLLARSSTSWPSLAERCRERRSTPFSAAAAKQVSMSPCAGTYTDTGRSAGRRDPAPAWGRSRGLDLPGDHCRRLCPQRAPGAGSGARRRAPTPSLLSPPALRSGPHPSRLSGRMRSALCRRGRAGPGAPGAGAAGHWWRAGEGAGRAAAPDTPSASGPRPLRTGCRTNCRSAGRDCWCAGRRGRRGGGCWGRQPALSGEPLGPDLALRGRLGRLTGRTWCSQVVSCWAKKLWGVSHVPPGASFCLVGILACCYSKTSLRIGQTVRLSRWRWQKGVRLAPGCGRWDARPPPGGRCFWATEPEGAWGVCRVSWNPLGAASSPSTAKYGVTRFWRPLLWGFEVPFPEKLQPI